MNLFHKDYFISIAAEIWDPQNHQSRPYQPISPLSTCRWRTFVHSSCRDRAAQRCTWQVRQVAWEEGQADSKPGSFVSRQLSSFERKCKLSSAFFEAHYFKTGKIWVCWMQSDLLLLYSFTRSGLIRHLSICGESVRAGIQGFQGMKLKRMRQGTHTWRCKILIFERRSVPVRRASQQQVPVSRGTRQFCQILCHKSSSSQNPRSSIRRVGLRLVSRTIWVGGEKDTWQREELTAHGAHNLLGHLQGRFPEHMIEEQSEKISRAVCPVSRLLRSERQRWTTNLVILNESIRHNDDVL